jgi:hypothetical protein
LALLCMYCSSATFMLRTLIALEGELGTCKPTVFRGNIMTILNAVRIRWNNNNRVLHI